MSACCSRRIKCLLVSSWAVLADQLFGLSLDRC